MNDRKSLGKVLEKHFSSTWNHCLVHSPPFPCCIYILAAMCRKCCGFFTGLRGALERLGILCLNVGNFHSLQWGDKNRIFLSDFHSLRKCRLTWLHICVCADTLHTLLISHPDPDFLRDTNCWTNVRSEKTTSGFRHNICESIKYLTQCHAFTLFQTEQSSPLQRGFCLFFFR